MPRSAQRQRCKPKELAGEARREPPSPLLLPSTKLDDGADEDRNVAWFGDMTGDPTHHVHEAVISLAEGTNPQAVGAAVTTELCGATEHEGPCRWPHNNAVVPRDEVTMFRTVFIAARSEEREVRRRIRSALRSSDEWDVISDRTRSLTRDERALADRLARSAQQADPA